MSLAPATTERGAIAVFLLAQVLWSDFLREAHLFNPSKLMFCS